MTITLPLAEMSVEEKLQIMESIWQDLCGSAAGSLSPEWHRSVLEDRGAAMQAGSDEILDWELAKDKIAEDIR